MDLTSIANIVQTTIVNSAKFPYRTGRLKNNFFDNNIQTIDNKTTFTVLSNPLVSYGKILQERASINYRTKNSTIRHKNRHFRYIDKIVNTDVISAIENSYGVKRIWI